MGIGAYESFQYVQELGGRVEVDSTPDVGTQVRLLLPAYECGRRFHTAVQGKSLNERERPSGVRISIEVRSAEGSPLTAKARPLLIVEDDPALQKQICWAFDQYETLPAVDRESALAQLRRHSPPVVTMDLGLPPGPGRRHRRLQAARADPRARAGHQGDRAHGPERPLERGPGDRRSALTTSSRSRSSPSSWRSRSIAPSACTTCSRKTAGCRQCGNRMPSAALLTRDPELLRICRVIEKVAGTGATVLLLGESGTGKELLARAVHDLSPRRCRALRRDQLRRDPRQPARKRALRLREGRVHRRRAADDRQDRDRQHAAR